MGALRNPVFWLILVNMAFFLGDFLLSVPAIKEKFFTLPRTVQRAFVIPIAVPPFVLPFLPQPRFEFCVIPAAITGALFVATGAILMISAFREIGVIPSAIPEEMRSDLVTTGIYGVIRNPIYSANIAITLGLSLLLRGMYALAYVPVVFVLFSLITVFEERELSESYGKQYRVYKENVSYRFIPKIV
jgi:protein-S-isoprenylcysteine O-methyltransferase Ste14